MKVRGKAGKFVGHEKALVFSTGMQTNLGTLPSICGPKDCMLFDGENHASTIDASRLSFGTTFKFKHNDMESLEEQLKATKTRFNRVTIVTDGVFSMTGALINLPKVVESPKNMVLLFILMTLMEQELWVLKVEGLWAALKLLTVSTSIWEHFPKALPLSEALFQGKKEIINHVKHCARSFMFSASMPPSAVATVSKCIDLLEQEPEILKKLWDNVEFIEEGLKKLALYLQFPNPHYSNFCRR